MDTPETPYLTGALPGTGGSIKNRPEDFRVDEVPLYEPSGEGTHVYFRVLKRGVPTPAAVGRIAGYMGVKPREIGFAGLKDAAAETTQTMSLEHADAGKLAAYADPQVRVLWTDRHTNKLRPGHLRGNRFTIRIRGVGEAELSPARDVLAVLERRGTPNYFGPQRFGTRGDTAKLGERLVRGDLEGFVRQLLGGALPCDPPEVRAARDAFDAGFHNRALKLWPRQCADPRRALQAYRRKGKPGPAVSAVNKRMRRLYVSAFQSALFNAVLARRIDSIDRLFAGDFAQKPTGAGFLVEDPAVEQPRVEAWEISPTGPILGSRTTPAEGEPGRIEQAVFDEWDLSAEDFRRVGSLKVKGARRPLRFRVKAPTLSTGRDEHGEYLELSFEAAAGAYATVVLREIMKDEPGPRTR